MGKRSKQIAVIAWSVTLAVVVLLITVSVMLPSTKRASPEVLRQFEKSEQEKAERAAQSARGAQSPGESQSALEGEALNPREPTMSAADATSQPAIETWDKPPLVSTKSGAVLSPRVPELFGEPPAATQPAETKP